jgi:hypothetical protein
MLIFTFTRNILDSDSVKEEFIYSWNSLFKETATSRDYSHMDFTIVLCCMHNLDHTASYSHSRSLYSSWHHLNIFTLGWGSSTGSVKIWEEVRVSHYSHCFYDSRRVSSPWVLLDTSMLGCPARARISR